MVRNAPTGSTRVSQSVWTEATVRRPFTTPVPPAGDDERHRGGEQTILRARVAAANRLLLARDLARNLLKPLPQRGDVAIELHALVVVRELQAKLAARLALELRQLGLDVPLQVVEHRRDACRPRLRPILQARGRGSLSPLRRATPVRGRARPRCCVHCSASARSVAASTRVAVADAVSLPVSPTPSRANRPWRTVPPAVITSSCRRWPSWP